MISVAHSAIENNIIAATIIEEKQVLKLKPVVICGSCGAQELAVDENKTECPNCDEYIY